MTNFEHTANPLRKIINENKALLKDKEFVKTIALKVIDCFLNKSYTSATIGHILKAQYNIKIKYLCRHFSFLDQKEEQKERLSTLNTKRKLHLSRNKKDHCVKRALVRSKLKHAKLVSEKK